MDEEWETLQTWALEEIEETLAQLPVPLQERAQALPVTFQKRPNAAQLKDHIEPDTLGLFVGPDFALEPVSDMPMPPQIILFLENILDQAEGDPDLFREEVHTTYMHELGHYLGLDEDDLFERGLE